jgi:hypothetical protein
MGVFTGLRKRQGESVKVCWAGNGSVRERAISSSETSVDFQLATRRYIPEDSPLHKQRSENLESCP